MNSTEEESTFFVSIDKKNIKNKINNTKNIKSKYFCQTIKTLKNIQTKKNNSSACFTDNQKLNKQLNKTPPVPPKNENNNVSKINALKNYIQKDDKSKSSNLIKKSDNNIINTDENIDIEDTDEYNDIKFNINQPKLPFYNRNNYIINHNVPSNVSRNIFNIHENKTSNNYSLIKKPNKNNTFDKNYKVSFENKDILKLRLYQNIATFSSKIDMLKNIIKRRNIQILAMQLIFEENNATKKIKKFNLRYDKTIDEIRKKILNLKIIKSKYEENYINKKTLEKEINQEIIAHSSKKAELIEKIMDYKIYIINKRNGFITTTNNFNNNNEESTIVNDSLFFDNETNILETKENLNMPEQKISKLKKSNKLLDKEEDDLRNKDNDNEINCMKNKNVSNYFVPRFLIETKTFNKNKNKNKHNLNTKFNVFINANNGQ